MMSADTKHGMISSGKKNSQWKLKVNDGERQTLKRTASKQDKTIAVKTQQTSVFTFKTLQKCKTQEFHKSTSMTMQQLLNLSSQAPVLKCDHKTLTAGAQDKV